MGDYTVGVNGRQDSRKFTGELKLVVKIFREGAPSFVDGVASLSVEPPSANATVDSCSFFFAKWRLKIFIFRSQDTQWLRQSSDSVLGSFWQRYFKKRKIFSFRYCIAAEM